MFLTASLLCSLFLFAGQAAPAIVSKAPPNAGPYDDAIHVSGGKNPELLPDHMVWRMTLGGLAFVLERKLPGGVERMKLGPADREVVLREARLQPERDRVCMEKQDKQRASLQGSGVTQAQIFESVKTVVLECRWETLRARNRIIAGLSPEGLTAFMAFVDDGRKSMSAMVPRSEWDYWQQPH